jgi:hypothetical protein
MFWMTFDGTMNSALFTEFLDLLIHDIDGRIFVSIHGDEGGVGLTRRARCLNL